MNLLQFVGGTPLIRLERSSPNPNVSIWAKLEHMNPTGSLKDRIALYMIEQAEERGDLRPGMIITEATSGNTGIALGMVAAAKGYKLKLFMSERKTIERRKMLKIWGADLVLTSKDDPDSHIYAAKALAEEEPDNYFYINQNENEDNVLAHYHGTGKEIAEQSGGKVDVFLSGFGTGGMLMGVGRCLRDKGVLARIVAIEPAGQGSRIDGLKHSSEAYQPKIYDKALIDETIEVGDEDAIEAARSLAVNEGLIAGISSGANLHAARLVAGKMERGNIVTVVCDRGERYFSTDLFR